MKKYVFALFVALVGIYSCEIDDFCSLETTPRLIISFYDVEDPTEYKEVPLYAWANEMDSIYNAVIVDSIYIPLDPSANSITYKLSHTKEVDQIDFTYEVDDVFVSESCGFKSTFKNLKIVSNTNVWIQRIDISNAIIENETQAHVKIYH
ncbi:DUF6452 family protein [Flavicella sediminum]|uniref:DUF6452 family protein n=1 Tax=Flavicella sediminum TaxID=2585141 RepID=UPI00111D91B3|nr:DUF6452 family protein [Flavicella sediminum]